MRKVSLILGGSFYPIHDGHIELLSIAKNYYESKFEIVDIILCPNHFESLSKKFKGITKEDDTRLITLKQKLDNISWITLDLHIINSEENIGFKKFIQTLTEQYLLKNITLIQICGTDSRIKFAKNNPNALIINTGRHTYDENKRIMKYCTMITIYPYPLKTTSTIERFLEQNKYPFCSISEFSLSWLSDSGITLGEGAQGIVRLMFLGKKEVAVKLYDITNGDDKNSFNYERNVLECANRSILDIYHIELLEERIGVIIMNVGCPLSEIFNIHHSYVKRYNRNNSKIVEYFISKVDKYYVEYEQTNLYKMKTLIKSMDKNIIKKNIISGLETCTDKLKKVGIFHRDLYYDNIIVTYNNDEFNVHPIDFGVAKKHNSDKKIGRGALRYYPIIAIDNIQYYDYFCDRYMIYCLIYEIIEEHEIYPECGGETREIIKKRRNKEYPVWKNNSFPEIVLKVNAFWREY